MSLPNTARAYDDCYQALEKAMADKKGIRIKMQSVDAATYFRMRCHKARAIERKNNSRIYDRDHPMWGCSAYDCIIIRSPVEEDDGVYLYFEKNEVVPGKIESLSGETDEEYVEEEEEELQTEEKPMRRV